ncbi:FAD monooxygenase-like protein [Aaosphaeria arxii CBS 175.79]|uniref:FAD monooxygenase-like protein n=1 Tax=Aaosphaeria arxii CBS 175.79 TaxID=1450172 RepID=A0A6A5XAF2_9PLEO|nr:FAD monooxygenase-like protein [Aaosphaeria arxii CBS 175.79]KAF2009889.1 FAD monooxygenase-like protein [Aaosphaeria arxii CBS 175.79]
MAPGLTVDSNLTTRSNSFDIISHTSGKSNESSYQNFLSDVVVVGAGPSGLMLADNLVRYGIKTQVVDNRPDATSTGRADGIQPKTIETLRQMRLADPVLRKGVKVYDIAFWSSTAGKTLHRKGREVHYPPDVDLLDPYVLLCHQGMIEDLLIKDLRERGVEVARNTAFVGYESTPASLRPMAVTCHQDVEQMRRTYRTRYIVGCDGAHSRVRKALPNSVPIGSSTDAVWGVIDGVLDTDFPDIWSKVVVQSEELGTILMCPRERNMTRLYIELKPGSMEVTMKERATQEFVQMRAQEIMQPYRLRWRNVEWFGRYVIGQRVASHFTDPNHTVFIAGDASHTHSPKASQGMNTSIHDSWNLAWKLNFAVRGLAKPALLQTYEEERKKIAQDLVDFDSEHASAFTAGNPEGIVENFTKNTAFMSGYGVTYNLNVLNMSTKSVGRGLLKPGYLLPPAKVTRFIDCNSVDIQTDIPALGQFRIYFFTRNVFAAMPFIDTVCNAHTSTSSYVGRVTTAGNASYTMQPPLAAPHDQFVCPERYTPVSGIFTYALVTDMPRQDIEIEDLPLVMRDSRWTIYLDDVPHLDTRKQTCMDKWFGGIAENEVAVVNVRPDGYVGTLGRWRDGTRESGLEAVRWMDQYYEKFMRDT